MSGGKLSPLERRILRLLARLSPPWTRTGGGALAGFHLGHRSTRDLDLFWRRRSHLGHAVADAVAALRSDGLEAERLRTTPMLAELRVADGKDVCIVDMVAEPTAALEPPQVIELDGVSLTVDTPYEILVNKLTSLLGRSEVRDLVDVRELLDAGGDLSAAVRDAPVKDGGFSPLALAWTLQQLPVPAAARSLGWSAADAEALDSFRRSLIQRLTEASAPPE